MFDYRKTFNAVKAHLLEQNAKSQREKVESWQDEPQLVCVYRSPEGRKCAIGALIPDELFRPEMEGKSASGVLCDFGPVIAGTEGMFEYTDQDDRRDLWTLEERDVACFLDALQNVHDTYKPEVWPEIIAELESAFFEPEAFATKLPMYFLIADEANRIRERIHNQEKAHA